MVDLKPNKQNYLSQMKNRSGLLRLINKAFVEVEWRHLVFE